MPDKMFFKTKTVQEKRTKEAINTMINYYHIHIVHVTIIFIHMCTKNTETPKHAMLWMLNLTQSPIS